MRHPFPSAKSVRLSTATLASSALTICSLSVAAPRAAHAQARLTGAIVYGSTQTGDNNSSGTYNTVTDGSFDLAVIRGTPDQGGAADSGFNARNGAFLNNLDTARIDLLLSVPGDYTFTILGGTAFAGPFNGLNLFFAGEDIAPRISVFGPQQTSAAVSPGFSVNSSPSSLNLFAGGTAASGTATFSSGSVSVTLTGFSYGGPDLYASPTQVDRLGTSIASGSDGSGDAVGQFTLRVSNIAAAAPEPSALALLALPAGLVIRKRRRLREA